MTPWIQVSIGLPGHRKMSMLRDQLGLKTKTESVGIVVCLWSWAAANASDGRLNGFSPADIADAVGWKKSGEKLIDALIDCALIDKTANGLVIHDWETHQGMYQDAQERVREQGRKRVERYRKRQKERTKAEGNGECNVTHALQSDACNAPTIPNHTKPYHNNNDVVVDLDDTGVTSDGGQGDRLQVMGGELGQGVVMLSDAQTEDLLDRLGLEVYDVYVKRLAGFVQRTGVQCNHYQTILKWWRKDGGVE